MIPPILNQQEILITRSEKHCSKLIEILRDQNKAPYVFPILEISPFSSNKIKESIITLLNNLYKSLSNLIPKNIEWTVNAIAEPTPKKIIFFRFL